MKDDGKLLEMLRKSAEDVEVPKGLTPEAIEEKLKEQESREADKKKKGMRPWMYRACAAAAAVILLVGGYNVLKQQEGMSDAKKESVGAAMEGEQTDAAAAMAEATAKDTEEAVPRDGGAGEDALTADGDASLGGYMTVADSYSDIYEKLQEYSASMESEGTMMDVAGGEEREAGDTGAAEETVSDTEDMALLKGGEDYSETNVQVEGVDEGDIVKTDGTYLYVLRKESGVKIVRAGDLKLMSEISWKNADTEAYEMYFDDGRLTVIVQERRANVDFSVEDNIKILVYDVSDPEHPKIQEGLTQDGEYLTSRKNGDYLYLFGRFYPEHSPKERQPEMYVPKINGKLLEEDCIYLPKGKTYGNAYNYLVVTSVDLTDPKKAVETRAMVTDSNRFYVSRENIYATETYYENNSISTIIVKFGYDKGKLTPVAGGIVPGELLEAFSMDEYRGYLRVVSSSWADGYRSSGLYVLDEKLDTAGRIGDLAPGEQLKSARFMGDEGYFVTFLETDPLFSVDLSDPENPKIIGELKIPGFSSYLHFLEEDQLLGIGWEDNRESGWRELKLSMFDISDPSDVKETDKVIISKAMDSPAVYDYKSVLVDSKGRFGFAYGCPDERYDWRNEAYYYAVYRYEEGKGFVEAFKWKLNQEEGFETGYLGAVRGVTIGNTLYVVMSGGVSSFDLDSGEKTGSMKW